MLRFYLAAAVSLLLAACAAAPQATPYQPQLFGTGEQRYGYADRPINDEIFHVSFAGNPQTSRERVEAYMLYRAAELTEARGFPRFAILEKTVEREIRKTTVTDWPYYGHPGFGWPHRRYPYRYGYPYYGYPYGGYDRTYETTRFMAEALVQPYDRKAPDGAAAIHEVAEVKRRIGPTLVRPANNKVS
jgi:hypothetical protein